MASIVKGFDAKVIKNIGDGLICYFPKTSDQHYDAAFRQAGITALAARHNINAMMHEEKYKPGLTIE